MPLYRAILLRGIQSPADSALPTEGGNFSSRDIFNELFSTLAKASFIQNIFLKRLAVLLSLRFL